MSDVAKLELCKELYELSGWPGSPAYVLTSIDGVELTPRAETIPRYDLGYLLRKLRGNEVQIYEQVGERWTCLIGEGDYAKNADTPEDAAAKLAIELFKQGVLKKEGGGDE